MFVVLCLLPALVFLCQVALHSHRRTQWRRTGGNSFLSVAAAVGRECLTFGSGCGWAQRPEAPVAAQQSLAECLHQLTKVSVCVIKHREIELGYVLREDKKRRGSDHLYPVVYC